MNLKDLFNNKVVKAGSWYTFTNFFVNGLSFLTIPIFTRLLSTSDYGIVSLYNTWVAIFTIIISLSLTESIRRAKYDFPEDYDGFTSSIAFLSLVIFIIYFMFSIIFLNPLSRLMDLSENLFIFMILQSYYSFIRQFLITKLRFEYKYKLVSIITIFISIAGIFLSIYFIKNIFNNNKYIGRILGNGSLIIIFGIIFLIYIFIKGKKFIEIKYWKYALLLSIPLVIHQLSSIVNAQFDRIIINKFLGESITGIYSFAYNVGMIIQIIYISMDQAWVPWFFEKMENKNYFIIKKRANNYLSLFILIYAIVLMLSPELVRVMASPSYWDGLIIIPWIFLGYFFRALYGFEVSVEFSQKKTGLISLATILSAGVNIILNIVFVPIYGYIAAAITTTISYMFLFIFHYFITSKILKIKVYGFRFYFKYILISFVFTIYFIIFQDNFIFRILFVVIILLFSFRILKKYLNKRM